jgi:hypothetical protein
MEELKSPRLSQNWVAIMSFVSNFNNTSKYETDVKDSVVSLISSSFGYIESTCD